ncbi:MAG: ABC transporter ATP-binding protein, partial [Clostridium sp.]|nr:ABC transporter ATP-binding protein [Clostridium sp.]
MIKIFKNLNKKDYFLMPIIILLIVLQVYLELRIPEYMTQITTLVKTNGTINEILTEGIYMTLCAFLSLISSVIVGYIVANITANFSLNVRRKLFTKVNDFSLEEIKKFSTSSLITRTTNDVTNLEMLLSMGLQLLIKAPITAIWAIKKILGKNFTWSVVTGSAVLILIVMIVVLVILVLPKFKLVQKLIDRINGLTRENLKGIRVIRAFNAEEFHENKFERQNKKLTDTQMFNQKVMSITSPVMYLIMNGVSLAIYFTGAYMLDSALFAEKIDLFSNMVVFTSYAMQVISSFLMLAMIFIMYPRASISADRINEVLDTKCKIKDGKISEGKIKGKVEFKNVSFKYEDDNEEFDLTNINISIKSGETIGIIGGTGSAKTSLVQLIPRLYDVNQGEVLVGGVNVKDYKLETLRNEVSMVLQKNTLFSGTIRENLMWGNENATQEQIDAACKAACVDEFLDRLPGGLDMD